MNRLTSLILAAALALLAMPARAQYWPSDFLATKPTDRNVTATLAAAASACGSQGAVNANVAKIYPVGDAAIGLAVSGTFVGTISFYATIDDSNFFAVGAYPVTAPNTSAITTTATGNWLIPNHGYQAVCARFTAYTSGSATVVMQANPASAVDFVAPLVTNNPCMDPTSVVTTYYGATSGNSLTQIVAAVSGQKIYLCSIAASGVSGTNPTISFSYGTGSNCGTGTQTMIGPIATTANTLYTIGGDAIAVLPTGNALCYTGGGTTPVQNLMVTYVQR